MEQNFLLEPRVCSRCKEEKPTFDFFYNSGSRICKACHNKKKIEKNRKLGAQPHRARKF